MKNKYINELRKCISKEEHTKEEKANLLKTFLDIKANNIILSDRHRRLLNTRISNALTSEIFAWFEHWIEYGLSSDNKKIWKAAHKKAMEKDPKASRKEIYIWDSYLVKNEINGYGLTMSDVFSFSFEKLSKLLDNYNSSMGDLRSYLCTNLKIEWHSVCSSARNKNHSLTFFNTPKEKRNGLSRNETFVSTENSLNVLDRDGIYAGATNAKKDTTNKDDFHSAKVNTFQLLNGINSQEDADSQENLEAMFDTISNKLTSTPPKESEPNRKRRERKKLLIDCAREDAGLRLLNACIAESQSHVNYRYTYEDFRKDLREVGYKDIPRDDETLRMDLRSLANDFLEVFPNVRKYLQ